MAEFQHRRQRHSGGSGSADPGDFPPQLTGTVPPDLSGERVDKVIAVLAGISRSAASKLIAGGGVLVDGHPVSGRDRLDEGVIVSYPEPSQPDGLQPDSGVPFTVRYEDDYLAVVDKPAGIVVHPGAGRETGTLASGVLARWPEIRGVGEPDRWGIVHRLDRETSGLLLIAKRAEAHDALQAAIAARQVTRRYYALVHGRPGMTTGTIDAPIGRDPSRATRMVVTAEGRPARTHYTLESAWGDRASLLDVSLETGRTHQIRVHLASIGHPVFDDRAYGKGGAASGAGRLWLHAHHLEFDHPVTGERVLVDAPLPADLSESLDAFSGEPSDSANG
jgi:23S rRNA pseudouridine1911/1915/1917 synthase